MRGSSKLVGASLAIAVAIALVEGAEAQTNIPRPTYKYEKCFGIVRGGQNDCFSPANSCGKTSKRDNDPNAWIYVPVSTCDKITGGSTAPTSGSNLPPKNMMVAYSEATATTAGTSACTPVSIAMRKLCLSRTGWVIWSPLERERLSLYSSAATLGAT